MHAAAIVSFLQKTQEKAPDPNDVVAGWTGFIVFVVMIVAVVVIGIALVRSLRKAQRAKDSGAFGDQPLSGDAASAERPGEKRIDQ